MLILVIHQFLGLVALFFLVTFDKVIGLLFLSLLVLSLLATNWPGLTRVLLLVVSSVIFAGIFMMPLSVTLLILASIVYGWMFLDRAKVWGNLIRSVWLGFWSLSYYLIMGLEVGMRVSWWVIALELVLIFSSWKYLEKIKYGS